MISRIKKQILWLLIVSFFSVPFLIHAEVINVDASKLQARVEVTLSPSAGSFVEGSTFQVPILIDTKDRSVNGIEVHINFDPNKLLVVNPTGGTSIIGVWVDPPGFDNTRGTASYVGVVPNGITTQSGLIGTITFKAKVPGDAVVSISSDSQILLNDGLGTPAQVDLGRADYTILTKAPEGVQIFSETNPIQDDWYNNNSPTVSWIQDPGVTGFSYVLDDQPNTIPDNTIEGNETTKTFESLPDGLWYFHIKADKNGVWGTTGNFLMRIDSTPPAAFKPQTNYIVASAVMAERPLVSFTTTDNLSGIDHYEVGVIDEMAPATVSPVFVETDSPFQVPFNTGGKVKVIVRAVDQAGNVRDESIDVEAPFIITKFVQEYIVYILSGIILLGLVMLIFHYLVGHHIIRYIGHVRQLLKKEKIEEAKKEEEIEKMAEAPKIEDPPKNNA